MNCKLCGRPVVLVPSAQERAAKFGGSAAYYTKLFDTHASCAIDNREEDTLELIRRKRWGNTQ